MRTSHFPSSAHPFGKIIAKCNVDTTIMLLVWFLWWAEDFFGKRIHFINHVLLFTVIYRSMLCKHDKQISRQQIDKIADHFDFCSSFSIYCRCSFTAVAQEHTKHRNKQKRGLTSELIHFSLNLKRDWMKINHLEIQCSKPLCNNNCQGRRGHDQTSSAV